LGSKASHTLHSNLSVLRSLPTSRQPTQRYEMEPNIVNVGIAKPFIGEEEKQAVLEVLESGQLIQGPKVAAFEKAFAEYHQVPYAVATNNGTTALMAVMMAHRIGPGDEVIIPSFSFFATASCILSVGAHPVFADIDPQTFCLSPESAEAAITPKTKAIMPVHLYGQPADMPRFAALCEKYGLILLEDAAQAHGAALQNRPVGTWGTAAFSFYPTKNMMTTEGGMVLTNSELIANHLRAIRNQGMNQQYVHDEVGYNFRMTEICAAIGIVQLQRLPRWTEQRIANAAFYDGHLRTVITPYAVPDVTHVYHQYTVRVRAGLSRDEAVKTLNSKGIGARVYYPKPIHCQPVFQQMADYPDLFFPHSETASKEVFSLPVHPALTREEQEYVVHEVNSLC